MSGRCEVWGRQRLCPCPQGAHHPLIGKARPFEVSPDGLLQVGAELGDLLCREHRQSSARSSLGRQRRLRRGRIILLRLHKMPEAVPGVRWKRAFLAGPCRSTDRGRMTVGYTAGLFLRTGHGARHLMQTSPPQEIGTLGQWRPSEVDCSAWVTQQSDWSHTVPCCVALLFGATWVEKGQGEGTEGHEGGRRCRDGSAVSHSFSQGLREQRGLWLPASGLSEGSEGRGGGWDPGTWGPQAPPSHQGQTPGWVSDERSCSPFSASNAPDSLPGTAYAMFRLICSRENTVE